MNYLLDTNIVIIYSKSRELAERIEARYQIFAAENKLSKQPLLQNTAATI